MSVESPSLPLPWDIYPSGAIERWSLHNEIDDDGPNDAAWNSWLDGFEEESQVGGASQALDTTPQQGMKRKVEAALEIDAVDYTPLKLSILNCDKAQCNTALAAILRSQLEPRSQEDCVVKKYAHCSATYKVTIFSMPIKQAKYFDVTITNNEKTILILRCIIGLQLQL